MSEFEEQLRSDLARSASDLEVHRDLDAIITSSEPARTTGTGPSSGARRFPVGGGMVAAGVLVLALVGGLVAVGSTRSNNDTAPLPTTATDNSAVLGQPTLESTLVDSPTTTAGSSVSTPTLTSLETDRSEPSVDPVAVLVQLDETSRLANEAVMSKTGECMDAAGFDFEEAKIPASSVEWIEQLYRPWSSPDPTVAAEVGYQLAGEMPAILLAPDTQRSAGYESALYGNEVGFWELAPDDQTFNEQALSGPILDGCFPSAQREIIGGGDAARSFFVNDASYFLQNLNNTAVRAVLVSDELADLQPTWSQCMTDAGYSYSRFTEVPAAFVADTSTPNAIERAVATADAECRDSSGIATLGDQLFTTAATDLIEAAHDSLDFISVQLDGISARARGAVS